MTILDRIIAQKEMEVRELKAIYPCRQVKPQKRRPLFESIRRSDTMSVIAEVKRASPSKGDIHHSVDPVMQAKKYEEAGASAISVLTDRQFFKGSLADLAAVSAAICELPLLCKDFMIDRVQIDAAVEHGASVILLIAAALSEEKLKELFDYAKSMQLDVLLEVHNEREAETAVNIGANIVGINNRDLKTFHVDLAVTERVAAILKNEDIVIVSESGLQTGEDAAFVKKAGASAVLVGETLMRANDIGVTMANLKIPLMRAVR
ncbi:indole-3-glycerol phosphate synthase TrpC [Siminovitchia sp. 179-K 8D1 HS]|uniref:indole-3-glycerol phosphate synthase TrpC n=1 Tax=Siminovitchia sp. 179-K 8D1 HS TaxID=3142385 RepID=UPI0039A161B3